MSRNGTSVAMPMGVRFDPERSLTENAASAWEGQRTLDRGRALQNARIHARRIFRTDEFDVSYPLIGGERVPVFSVEDFLVAFKDSEFGIVEFCADCGKQWALHTFNSLAMFGRAIENFRDEDDAFVCRTCSAYRAVKKS